MVTVADEASPSPFSYESTRGKTPGSDDAERSSKQYTRLTAQIAAKSARRASHLGTNPDRTLSPTSVGGDPSGPWGILKKQQQQESAWSRFKQKLQRLGQAMVIMPGSERLQNWFFLCVGMALISGWTLPFHFAFMEAGGVLRPYKDWTAILEYVGTTLFLCDFIVRFFVAYVDPDTGALVTRKRTIARHYIKSWQCALDFLGWFPLDWIIVDSAAAAGASEDTLTGLGWIKLLHLARLYRVFELFSDLDYRMVLSQGALLLTRNYTYVIYCTHWAACMLYHIARHEGFSPESWVGRNRFRLVGRPMGEKYLLSLYFSISAFTGLGDGALFAGTVPEAGFMILYLMFNLFLGAYILGTVTMLVVKGDERSKEFRELMSNLTEFSKNHDLPERLTTAMQEHLEVTFNTEQVDDEHVLGIYPTTIRRKVLRHLYLHPVKSCYLFRGCKQRFLDALLTAARVELFMPGVQLLTEGDNVVELNIIVSGAVLVAEAGINLTAAFSQFASTNDPSNRSRSGRGDISVGGRSNRGFTDGSVSLGRSSSMSKMRSMSMNASTKDMSLHSATGFMALAATKQIETRYSSEPLAEVPFFTDVPSNETIMSQSVVRVLSLPKSAWEALMTQFPQQARLVLNNLQNHADSALSQELQEASDMCGLSEEQLKQALAQMKDKDKRKGDKKKGGKDKGKDADPTLLNQMMEGLPESQVDVMSRLHDVRSVVRAHVRKVDQVRTFEFLGCASDGNLESLRTMLNQGVSPNACDYDGRTGLMLAAAAGHESAVRLLLDSGAKSDQLDAFGNSAMCEAVKNSHDNVIDLLLSYGATLGMEPMAVASTMCTAVFEGDLVKLRRLLRSGAPPDACDYDKRSALHIAGAEGNLAAVKLLVEEGGADPNFQDRWGNTALDESRRVGAAPVVAYLEALLGREQLAEAAVRYRQHVTTEFLTACNTGDAERARFMAQHLQPGCVFTGLALAASKGHKGLVEMLIVWVPADLLLADGCIALAEAARMGRCGAVVALRSAGVKLPDPRDGSLLAALHTAVLAADVRVVAAMLAAGVDISAAKQGGGGGLLHSAALTGSLELVRRLVEDGGMPPGTEDAAGKTPATVAESAKFPRVAEYLRWAASTAAATPSTASGMMMSASGLPPATAGLAAAAAARFGPLPNYREDEAEASDGDGSDTDSDSLAPATPFGGDDPDLPRLLVNMGSFSEQRRRGGAAMPLSRDSSLQRGGLAGVAAAAGPGPVRKQVSIAPAERQEMEEHPHQHQHQHHHHHHPEHNSPHHPHPGHQHAAHHHGGHPHLPPPPPVVGFHHVDNARTSSLTGFLIQNHKAVHPPGHKDATQHGEHGGGGSAAGHHHGEHASSVHFTVPSDADSQTHAPARPPSRGTAATATGGVAGATAGSSTGVAGIAAAPAAPMALSAPHPLHRPYGGGLPVLLEEDTGGRTAGVSNDGPPPRPPPPPVSVVVSAPSLPKTMSTPHFHALVEGPPRRQNSGPPDMTGIPTRGALSPAPAPGAQPPGGPATLTRLRSLSVADVRERGASTPTAFVLEVAPAPSPSSLTAAAPSPSPSPVPIAVTTVVATAAAGAGADGANRGAFGSLSGAGGAAVTDQTDFLESYLAPPSLPRSAAPTAALLNCASASPAPPAGISSITLTHAIGGDADGSGGLSTDSLTVSRTLRALSPYEH